MDMMDAKSCDNRLSLWSQHEDAYHKRAKKVLERYRDDKRKTGKAATPRMNILWSNTETLRPSIFSAIPNPVAKRRFLKSDPAAMEGSMVLERNLSFSMDNGVDDFEGFAECIVNDYLLPGRSVDRAMYMPVRDEETDEVLFDEVKYHHVPWEYFAYDPQDRWQDVDWVGFGDNFYTRKALKKEFGLTEAQIAGVPFNTPDKTNEEPTVQVWEIWDKDAKKVYWHAEGAREILRTEDPPVDLKGFFDIPPPLYSVKTNDSLIPIPEFTLYQYQADEIDKLTVRIQKIINTIRLNFAYAGDSKAVLDNLLNSDDGTGIPVADWSAILERGGIEGMIAYTPVKESVGVLQVLVQQRQILIQQIFEITGISDIFRGNSDPRETARAQSLKASFGSHRLVPRQRKMQNYLRSLLRISAEIIAQKFSVKTMADIAGVERISEQAVALLRDDEDRLFSIDIEMDSTIAADEQQQKQEVIEFMGAMAQIFPVAQQMAVIGGMPVVGGVLLWAIRRFRVGKDVEQLVEQMMQQLEQQQARQPQQQQPDPRLVKVQQEGALKQNQQQFEQQMSSQEFQLKVMEILTDIKNSSRETDAKVAALEAQADKARRVA